MQVTAHSFKKNKFMSQSIKQLYGKELGATDGEIGHVKDFYFDDQNWAVRYLVVDTGSWLSEQQVLISPYVFGKLDLSGKLIRVKLSRKQIEKCPPIAAHKPVSRQYEEEYHAYYGWPSYWQGDGLWGASAFPILERNQKSVSPKPAKGSETKPATADLHLRSTKAVNGYHLQTAAGIIGHVCDFIMDGESWRISELVVKTGHRFSGQEERLPTDQIDRISYEDSTVFANGGSPVVETLPLPGLV
jgi:hypothetical protein